MKSSGRAGVPVLFPEGPGVRTDGSAEATVAAAAGRGWAWTAGAAEAGPAEAGPAGAAGAGPAGVAGAVSTIRLRSGSGAGRFDSTIVRFAAVRCAAVTSESPRARTALLFGAVSVRGRGVAADWVRLAWVPLAWVPLAWVSLESAVVAADEESSARATQGAASAPPMPRAIAKAPTRPMDAAAVNDMRCPSSHTLVTAVTRSYHTVLLKSCWQSPEGPWQADVAGANHPESLMMAKWQSGTGFAADSEAGWKPADRVGSAQLASRVDSAGRAPLATTDRTGV